MGDVVPKVDRLPKEQDGHPKLDRLQKLDGLPMEVGHWYGDFPIEYYTLLNY